MEKGKILKILVLIYFLGMLLVAFLTLKDIFIIRSSPTSRLQVLNVRLLDSSLKALNKRNYIYDDKFKSIDLDGFIFGNTNPFQ
jgi:hypothetical protein